MAVPFLSVNLRAPACDFEPLMLAPDRPMLDLPAGQTSGRVLRKWLGDVVAQPNWTSQGIVYFLPLEDSTSNAAHPQCIAPRDLRCGPIRAQYLGLCALLSQVQPEAGEAALLSAVCRSFEGPDPAARLSQLGDCLFKYRDAQHQWRLVWAWGYRRKADRAGRASLCQRCSHLSVPKGKARACPACGWSPRPRLLAAAALASLLIGFGLCLWALTRPDTVQPDIEKQPVAAAAIDHVLPVEPAPILAPAVPHPVPKPVHDADETIARVIQPIQPVMTRPRHKPAHSAVLIKPDVPARPARVEGHPPTVASAAPQGRVITASARPATILARPVSTPLPSGVRVDPDGKVYLGYRSVPPTFEATTQYAPSGNEPTRYIYGSHVYAESQDTLHAGQPALQQWQRYVMSDDRSDRPAHADVAGRGVSLVLVDRGTDAEITDAARPGVDSWAENGSAIHLVQTSASKTTAAYDTMPHFDLPVDHPPRFYPTTPRCHSKHHHGLHGVGGYGPYIAGPTDPALFSRFTPSPRAPTLDAKLTVVALQYFGHSSPDEVLADLENARSQAQTQADTQNSGAHQAMLHLCDSEIALWRDVVGSSATADEANAAYRSGDVQRAGELCRQYQSQVAIYADRAEWSLFDTQSQKVGSLADKLKSESAAGR